MSSPKLHSLNMKRNYGQSRHGNSWDAAAGFRELVQNLFDGILQTKDLQQHQIRVEEWRDGQLVTVPPPSNPSQDTPTPSTPVPEYGVMVEFYFYQKDDLPPKGRGKKLSPLGYVAWRPSSCPDVLPGIGDVELYNVGRMLASSWSLGSTTKARKKDLIGQFGDGAKIGNCSPIDISFIRALRTKDITGVNAIMKGKPQEGKDYSSWLSNYDRKAIPCELYYHTGNETWAFGYDEFDELSYYVRKSKLVDGVMTQIHHLPWTATDFDRFLFLRPPTSTFPETAEQRAENKTGWVLLDDRHRSKIFVR